MRGCLDDAQKLLNLAFDKCRRFSFGPRKSLRLDFPGGIHGQHSFFGEPGKQHPDGGHVLFNRGRHGLALKDFDIRGNRDRFDVFKVLITGALSPGQKLLDRPVIGGSGVSVPDRDRKNSKNFLRVDGLARVMSAGAEKESIETTTSVDCS